MESELISLISKVIFLNRSSGLSLRDDEVTRAVKKTISFVSSMDFDLMPKPQSELILLTAQLVSLVSSISDSAPESELISRINQYSPLVSSSSELDQQVRLHCLIIELAILEPEPELDSEFVSLFHQTLSFEPEPEIMSLIRQIFCLVNFMNLEWRELIPLSPQAKVTWGINEDLFLEEDVPPCSFGKWHCFFGYMGECNISPPDSSSTYFYCTSCNGECHKDNEKVPTEIKHPLHPKHFLQLVLFGSQTKTRECYCCDEDLETLFYYCPACDFAMNIVCVEKPLVLSIDQRKWHDHTLALFPSQASFPCNLCALVDSTSCPFYICPLCDFVVHESCLSLPRVIRISRHLHRISFTHSFHQGDWSCGVCRKTINNDYGGYSCTKDGCSYAAHSKCATQSNVWDGVDLEGKPEETGEEVEPFVRINDEIIQHFSHEHHHLTLDEDTGRDYDEDKLCHACIMPIYFGNFYFCITCEFILHEACANLSRKLYHPVHPHLLTLDLVRGNDDVLHNFCSTCLKKCTDGFFYECGKEGCDFKLHVQCTTTSEPLVHKSHMHPLFLTSKPNELRECSVCKMSRGNSTNETFNCIECDGFALCFECTTIPQKVRYKHDKHILTLFYGNETSNETYWCEACERKINPKKRFYRCDEYCCATLHIDCLIGRDLYMKPGSTRKGMYSSTFDIIRNNHMSRPSCSICKERCPFKTALRFRRDGSIVCSLHCSYDSSFLS